MFGGTHAGSPPVRGDETWTSTGAAGPVGTWRQESPPVRPSPRDGAAMAAMAADPAAPASTSAVMLFGGFGGAGGGHLGDTWTWDGAPVVTTTTTTTTTTSTSTSSSTTTTTPVPVVRGPLTPGSGSEAGGTRVTIAGANLIPARSVGFCDGPEHQIACSEPGRCEIGAGGTIVVVSPPHAPGVVDVIVSTARGRSSSGGQPGADDFTYTADGIRGAGARGGAGSRRRRRGGVSVRLGAGLHRWRPRRWLPDRAGIRRLHGRLRRAGRCHRCRPRRPRRHPGPARRPRRHPPSGSRSGAGLRAAGLPGRRPGGRRRPWIHSRTRGSTRWLMVRSAAAEHPGHGHPGRRRLRPGCVLLPGRPPAAAQASPSLQRPPRASSRPSGGLLSRDLRPVHR